MLLVRINKTRGSTFLIKTPGIDTKKSQESPWHLIGKQKHKSHHLWIERLISLSEI